MSIYFDVDIGTYCDSDGYPLLNSDSDMDYEPYFPDYSIDHGREGGPRPWDTLTRQYIPVVIAELKSKFKGLDLEEESSIPEEALPYIHALVRIKVWRHCNKERCSWEEEYVSFRIDEGLCGTWEEAMERLGALNKRGQQQYDDYDDSTIQEMMSIENVGDVSNGRGNGRKKRRRRKGKKREEAEPLQPAQLVEIRDVDIPFSLRRSRQWNQGRLPANVKEWVESGFDCDLYTDRGELFPEQLYYVTSEYSTEGNEEEIGERLHELESRGILRKINEKNVEALSPVYLSNEDSSGKRELYCDMYEVNKMFPKPPKVHPPSAYKLHGRLNRGRWAAVVVVRSGEKHCQVHHSLQPYLSVSDPYSGRMFAFKTLPREMLPTVSILSRMLSATLKDPRLQGMEVSAYMEDILITGDTLEEATREYDMVLRVLQEYGWAIDGDKNQPPSQKVVYLGMGINLEEGNYYLSNSMKKALLADIDNVRFHGNPPCWMRAKLAGRLRGFVIACTAVKAFELAYLEGKDDPEGLDDEVDEDLDTLKTLVKGWKGSKLHPFVILTNISVESTRDHLYATFEDGRKVSNQTSKKLRNGPFDIIEAETILRTLRSHGKSLAGKSIRVVVYSQSLVRDMRAKRSNNEEMNEVIKKICYLLVQHDIHLGEIAYIEQ